MIDFYAQLRQPFHGSVEGTLLNIPGLAALHWNRRHGDQLLLTSQVDGSVAVRNAQAAGTAALSDGGWHHIAVRIAQHSLTSQAAVTRRFHVYNGAVNTRAVVFELYVDAQVVATLYVEMQPDAPAQSVAPSEIAIGDRLPCNIDHVRVWRDQSLGLRQLMHEAVTDADLQALAAFITFNADSDPKGDLGPHLVDFVGGATVAVEPRNDEAPTRSHVVQSGAVFGAPLLSCETRVSPRL